MAVRALPDVPAALSVTVEPSSPDDWELVEMNADHMEEQLLNQVGSWAKSHPEYAQEAVPFKQLAVISSFHSLPPQRPLLQTLPRSGQV